MTRIDEEKTENLLRNLDPANFYGYHRILAVGVDVQLKWIVNLDMAHIVLDSCEDM